MYFLCERSVGIDEAAEALRGRSLNSLNITERQMNTLITLFFTLLSENSQASLTLNMYTQTLIDNRKMKN